MALPGPNDPEHPDDTVNVGVEGWTDSGSAAVWVWRVHPPEPRASVQFSKPVKVGQGGRIVRVCAPAFLVAEGSASPSGSTIPRIPRPTPNGPYRSYRRGSTDLLREPLTQVERVGVAVGGLDRSARWICLAAGVMPIWDVDMMVSCYEDALEASRVRASAAADETMFGLWAEMGLIGVKALGSMYWERAAKCRGRIRNANLMARISATLAEDFWLAIHARRPPNSEWAGLLRDGDMPLPGPEELLRALSSPIALAPAARFLWAGRRFGTAHVEQGLAKALRGLQLEDAARRCLVDDLQVVGEILPRVQGTTFRRAWGWPALLADELLGDLSQRFFAPLLRSNLAGGLRRAGLEDEARALEARWA